MYNTPLPMAISDCAMPSYTGGFSGSYSLISPFIYHFKLTLNFSIVTTGEDDKI